MEKFNLAGPIISIYVVINMRPRHLYYIFVTQQKRKCDFNNTAFFAVDEMS